MKNEVKTIAMSKFDSMNDEILLNDRTKAIENSITNNEINELVMRGSVNNESNY